MRLTPWVGAIAPGRFADLVLGEDVASGAIGEVWADGQRSQRRGTTSPAPCPASTGPTGTVTVDRDHTAADFASPAPHGKATAQAALLRPFHWHDDFITMDLPGREGQVQRDPDRNMTRFAIVDRFSGRGQVARMFWLCCGPRMADSALTATLGQDIHTIWVTGSSDDAMAQAVNALRTQQGGWALVIGGTLAASVRYELSGLMTARPAADPDAEMQALYAAAARVDWRYEPTFTPRWWQGFPERLAFATLTCAPCDGCWLRPRRLPRRDL